MMLALAATISVVSFTGPVAAEGADTYVTASATTTSTNPPKKPRFNMPWQVGVYQ
jgi:hypothetical protein